MVFDFLDDKTKVIIAMAHIGALPGSPLYHADGGVLKLIEGVLADIEALQAGGVDAVMFGNENDRPYVLKAPLEGVAAMTAVIQAVKPHLRVPFGVNYLWTRSPASPSPRRPARASCARFSPASLLPTWGFGKRIARAPFACVAISDVTI